jgi:hypothetical protein
VREYLPIVEAVWTTQAKGGGTGSIAMGNLRRRRLLNRSDTRADCQAAANPAVVSVSVSSSTISQPWETA